MLSLSFVNCSIEWRGDHGAKTSWELPWICTQLVRKCTDWGLPNLEVVSEVRELGLRTTFLTCGICVDSGWCVSESNCSTAGKNYKRWWFQYSMLKTDWRETRADTGATGLGRPLQLRMVALDRVDVMEILRNDFIHYDHVDAAVFAGGLRLGFQWLDGAWFYYWGLSCLIWSAVDTQVVSHPLLSIIKAHNVLLTERHTGMEILLTDRLFLSPHPKQRCNKDAYAQLLDSLYEDL